MLTLEEADALFREVFPFATSQWSREKPRVDYRFGLEQFALCETENGPMLATWTGQVEVSPRVAGLSEYANEELDFRDHLAAWLSEVCDRIELDAQRCLVGFLRFPDALFPPAAWGAALYSAHLLKQLGAIERAAVEVEAAIPPWTWTEGSDSNKIARPLASEDGMSTGSLVANIGDQPGRTNAGFEFNLHSPSPTLLQSERLKKVTLSTANNLRKAARQMFITSLMETLGDWGRHRPLWGPVQRA